MGEGWRSSSIARQNVDAASISEISFRDDARLPEGERETATRVSFSSTCYHRKRRSAGLFSFPPHVDAAFKRRPEMREKAGSSAASSEFQVEAFYRSYVRRVGSTS